jgi:acyl carrier protein
MTNLEKYNSAFTETLRVSDFQLPDMQFNTCKEWDSVAHMQLIAALESTFDIMFEMDDIVDLNSYQRGKEIMLNYKIIIE